MGTEESPTRRLMCYYIYLIIWFRRGWRSYKKERKKERKKGLTFFHFNGLGGFVFAFHQPRDSADWRSCRSVAQSVLNQPDNQSINISFSFCVLFTFDLNFFFFNLRGIYYVPVTHFPGKNARIFHTIRLDTTLNVRMQAGLGSSSAQHSGADATRFLVAIENFRDATVWNSQLTWYDARTDSGGCQFDDFQSNVIG